MKEFRNDLNAFYWLNSTTPPPNFLQKSCSLATVGLRHRVNNQLDYLLCDFEDWVTQSCLVFIVQIEGFIFYRLMNIEIELSHRTPSSESCGSSGGRDFLQELLERPFSAWGVAEQKEIVPMPRPTAKLSLQTTMGRTVRRFRESWYSTRDW